MDDDRHASESFDGAHSDHFGNYVSVGLEGIEEVSNPGYAGNAGARHLKVEVNVSEPGCESGLEAVQPLPGGPRDGRPQTAELLRGESVGDEHLPQLGE